MKAKSLKVYLHAMSAGVGIASCLIGTALSAKASPIAQSPDTVPVTGVEVRQTVCILDTVYVDHSKGGRQTVTIQETERESFFPQASRSLSGSWFTWGADIGSSIDLSSDDMSTFDIELFCGYKNSFIRTLGVGVGVHQAFGNSHTFIPVFGMLRTSFTTRPSLLFGEVKGGYSFNTISSENSQGGGYFDVGIGINLAQSRHFRTHLILSYGWMGMKPYNDVTGSHGDKHINYAVLRLGINF